MGHGTAFLEVYAKSAANARASRVSMELSCTGAGVATGGMIPLPIWLREAARGRCIGRQQLRAVAQARTRTGTIRSVGMRSANHKVHACDASMGACDEDAQNHRRASMLSQNLRLVRCAC